MRLQYVLPGISRRPVDTAGEARLGCSRHFSAIEEVPMIGRSMVAASLSLIANLLIPPSAGAQDVPGIEICTVEKTMERRTSCLQSNVDFLQKTLGKLGLDHQQKLDATNRQIESLKSTVIGLQKTVEELQAAQKKSVEDQKKKPEPPPAKDGAK
jgi:hypothetical protein